MESVGNGVFKLKYPKQKEVIFVKKFDDEFERGGYQWQAFKMCDRHGQLLNPAPYYFCCMECGNYSRIPLKEKMKFNTKHKHESLGGSEDRNIHAGIDKVTESEAPFVLFFSLVKFVCNSNLAFEKASSEFLTKLVREAIEIGRMFPGVPVEILFPKISAGQISEQANFMGYSKHHTILNDLKGKKVSILMDAGKILTRRYLVLLLCRLGSRKPFFYYDFYTGAMDMEGYAKIAAKAKIVLKLLFDIEVVTFVSDLLSYQLNALSGEHVHGYMKYILDPNFVEQVKTEALETQRSYSVGNEKVDYSAINKRSYSGEYTHTFDRSSRSFPDNPSFRSSL